MKTFCMRNIYHDVCLLYTKHLPQYGEEHLETKYCFFTFQGSIIHWMFSVRTIGGIIVNKTQSGRIELLINLLLCSRPYTKQMNEGGDMLTQLFAWQRMVGRKRGISRARKKNCQHLLHLRFVLRHLWQCRTLWLPALTLTSTNRWTLNFLDKWHSIKPEFWNAGLLVQSWTLFVKLL